MTQRAVRTAPELHLRGKPPATSTVRQREPDVFRCDVAASAILRGHQDIQVNAVSYLASGTGVGHIAVRLGRVIVYLESREALQSALAAWQRAGELADNAFGPLCNRRKAETAARIRRDGGIPPQ